jgi:hypothetical protein
MCFCNMWLFENESRNAMTSTPKIPILKVLQPFCWGPWPLLHYISAIHSRQSFLDGGSARRKASIYTQDNINRMITQTDINALSRFRTQDSSMKRNKAVHTLDSAATVIGNSENKQFVKIFFFYFLAKSKKKTDWSWPSRKMQNLALPKVHCIQ